MSPKSNNNVTSYYKKKLWDYLVTNINVPSDDLKLVRKAYNVAFLAHKNQRRKGGDKEPFITHPVEVAIIASKEMLFGTTTVIACLLHDVVEDSEDYDIDYIKNKFGGKIATIVDGVTKITKVSGTNISSQMASFINLIKTIPKDFRVFVVKIADRLHNMRTMSDMPDNTRKIKASENLYLYGQIAELMGFWVVKNEIEDRSFEYLYNSEYQKICKKQKIYDNKTVLHLKKFQFDLQEFLGSYNEIIKIEEEYNMNEIMRTAILNYNSLSIQTIERSKYSIWKKMKSKNLNYEYVHNHYATRIIVDIPVEINRKIAYSIYLKISERFKDKEGSVRDWIKVPKKNGFRALVFDVMYEGKWQEIQIISKKDNQIALYGFPEIIGQKKFKHSIDDIMEDEHNDIPNIITSDIFVFSPQGDMFKLPKDSTVLDFAFKVHSNMGYKCIGAKINDNLAVKTPKYVLQTTQKVEILTSEKTVPKKEWLEFVKTDRAKKKIELYFREKNVDKVVTNKNIDYKIDRKKTFIINDDIEYQMARCCNPIIGDQAMVYKNDRNQLIIHKDNCKAAIECRAKYSKNTAAVDWQCKCNINTIHTAINIQGHDRKGIIREILTIVADELSINIKKIKVENYDGYFKGYIELYINTLSLLNKVITKIKNVEDVVRVSRIETGL